jgi:hypothetical protein
MQAARIDPHIRAQGSLWLENSLWLASLGLMVFWAWLVRRTAVTGATRREDPTPSLSHKE